MLWVSDTSCLDKICNYRNVYSAWELW